MNKDLKSNIMTIKELKRLCEIEELKGNGDKIIMIPSDDEQNDYHYVFKKASFATPKELEEPFEYMGKKYQFDFEHCDERIAKKDEHIILCW